MSELLNYERVLELIKETNRLSSERLEKERKKNMEEFDRKLEKDYKKNMEEFDRKLEKEYKKNMEEFDRKLEKDYKKNMEEFDKKLEKEFRQSRKEFDKKIGEITGTLGKFVEGMVKPKLLEMFQERGIEVTDVLHNVEIHDKKGQKLAEFDLLLINSEYSIAVEVKTTLTVDDIKEHIERINKLQQTPKRYVTGTTLLGAVAGMVIQDGADIYAYKKGLYVLRQKGEIMEIANDENFKRKEWVIS